MPYTFAVCDPLRERNEILDLWSSAFGELPDGRMPWMYADNPAGPPVCWVARSRDGHVVGFAAVVPRVFHFRGQPLLGGITADFSVAEGHRGLGPALRLQRALVNDAFAKGYDFLYGLPNRLSAPLLGRIGFRVVCRLTSHTRLLRSRSKLAERMPAAIAALAAPVLDHGATILQSVRVARPRTRRSRFSFLASFDSRFDVLQNEVRPAPLHGSRSAEFLDWRFNRSPHASYEAFVLADEHGGRCSGYVIFHTFHRRVIVDDLFCDPGLYDSLLYGFVRAQRARGNEAIVVSCLASSDFYGALNRNGFILRSAELDPLHVLVNPTSSRGDVAHDPASWWFFRVDNDI